MANLYVQSATSQSLFSAVTSILEESIEKKNESIPQVWQNDITLSNVIMLIKFYITISSLNPFLSFICNFVGGIFLFAQRVASVVKLIVQEIEQRVYKQAENMRKVNAQKIISSRI